MNNVASHPRGRRRSPRYRVNDVQGNLQVSSSVGITNLSVGGIGLETRTYLHPERAYALELADDKRHLALTARVAWSDLVGATRNDTGDLISVYRAGLRFDDLSNGEAVEIWSFIRDHAVVDLSDSVLGRFQLDDMDTASLSGSWSFVVRKLSLSGMLIQTESIPDSESGFELALDLDGDPFQAIARVASVLDPGARDRRAEVGVEFLTMEPPAAGSLEAYLRRQRDNA